MSFEPLTELKMMGVLLTSSGLAGVTVLALRLPTLLSITMPRVSGRSSVRSSRFVARIIQLAGS